MKHLLLILVVLTSSLPLWASNFLERVSESYSKTDSNFDLECRYSWNDSFKLITPKGSTRREKMSLSRDFLIESQGSVIPMSFRVQRNSAYEAVFDGRHVSRGTVSKREFYLAGISDKTFEAQFETTQIYCFVNFAYALPFELKDGNYHFSVHPQTNYDYQSRLSQGIEGYLNDPTMRSVIFLETNNFRGNFVEIEDFLDGRDPNLSTYEFETELKSVPESTALIVSPSGNSRFDFRAKKKIDILFTGGNHNYCMWNVTRHVLQDYFHSKSEAKVILRYDLGLIVAQPQGMEQTGLNFPRRDINHSNLLKDLLSTPQKQQNYHSTFILFFTDLLAREYAGMYKTYTVKYSAPGYQQELVLKGTGTRNLNVDFIYQ